MKLRETVYYHLRDSSGQRRHTDIAYLLAQDTIQAKLYNKK